jgi:hypothetical protein
VELVNDDALRNRLRTEAAAYAADFTWPPVIEQFVSLYRAVLAERRMRSEANTYAGQSAP